MRRLFGIIAIAAVAAVAGWNFSQSQNEVALSDLALTNINALANGEDIDGGELPGIGITCGAVTGYCWLWNGSWFEINKCYFTGNQSDWCWSYA